jgi:hypothetical protein
LSDLKQGDALSPQLFNFASQYPIKKVQEIQMRLKLNGTQQLVVYADDVNLLADKIKTMRKTQNVIIFRHITPYSPLKVNRHLQGGIIILARYQRGSR